MIKSYYVTILLSRSIFISCSIFVMLNFISCDIATPLKTTSSVELTPPVKIDPTIPLDLKRSFWLYQTSQNNVLWPGTNGYKDITGEELKSYNLNIHEESINLVLKIEFKENGTNKYRYKKKITANCHVVEKDMQLNFIFNYIFYDNSIHYKPDTPGFKALLKEMGFTGLSGEHNERTSNLDLIFEQVDETKNITTVFNCRRYYYSKYPSERIHNGLLRKGNVSESIKYTPLGDKFDFMYWYEFIYKKNDSLVIVTKSYNGGGIRELPLNKNEYKSEITFFRGDSSPQKIITSGPEFIDSITGLGFSIFNEENIHSDVAYLNAIQDGTTKRWPISKIPSADWD